LLAAVSNTGVETVLLPLPSPSHLTFDTVNNTVFVLTCSLYGHWKAGLGPSPAGSQALLQLYPFTGVRLYQSSTGIATESVVLDYMQHFLSVEPLVFQLKCLECCDRQSKPGKRFFTEVYQQPAVTARVTAPVTASATATVTVTAEWTRSEQVEPPAAAAV